jgi:hypothetical protein
VSRRRITIVLVSLVLVAAGTACGKPDQTAARELRAAMNRTARLSREFVYTEGTSGESVDVRGVVDDDFRYKARVDINGAPSIEEVISDDAIASRFLAPDAVDRFLEPSPKVAAGVDPSKVLQNLRTGQWVLDDAGAPPLVRASSDRRNLGADPVTDALTVFSYVEDAMQQMRVRKFSEFDLDYRPKEDPFPKPTKASGIIRYDFVRRPVPRPTGAAGNQVVPGIASFRKMSVYVKDGVVLEVREDVDVASRLNDLSKNYNIDLSRPGLTTDEAVNIAVDAINAVLRGQGTEPIRVRKMKLLIKPTASRSSVKLPTTTVEGDLSVLKGRGRGASLSQGQTKPRTDTGASTTTTTSAAATPTTAG